jgi:F0F1-type ATP synthase membrane subunit b/b'
MLRQEKMNPARLSAASLPPTGALQSNSLALPSSRNSEEAAAMELLERVHELEEMILLDGVKFPLGRRRLLDEDQLLGQVANLERCIPPAVQSAENILRQRENILSQAQAQAEEIIRQAKQRAEQITDELRIRRQAEQEAQFLREQVHQELNALRQQTVTETQQARRQAELELAQYRQQTEQEITQLRAAGQMEYQQTKVGADNYAEQVLTLMEQQLQQVRQQFTQIHQEVQNGRQFLRNPQR